VATVAGGNSTCSSWTPAHGNRCPFDIQPVGVDFGDKNHDEGSNNNHGNTNINNILQQLQDAIPFFSDRNDRHAGKRVRDGMSGGNGLVGRTTASGPWPAAVSSSCNPKSFLKLATRYCYALGGAGQAIGKSRLEAGTGLDSCRRLARGKTVVLILATGVYPRHHGGLFGIVFIMFFFGS
jgi:hypothetical protein